MLSSWPRVALAAWQFGCLVVVLCAWTAQAVHPGLCPTPAPIVTASFNPSADVFPIKTYPRNATLFTIEYYNYYKVVKNLKFNDTYVLVQQGTPASAINSIPLVSSSSVDVFTVPVTRVAVMDSTMIPFLEMFNVRSTVTNMTKYTASPCMNKLLESNVIEGFSMANYSDFLPVADLVMGHEYGVPDPVNATKFVAFDATSEANPLASAEWIKFLAVFFNKEHVANVVYDALTAKFSEQRASGTAAAQTYGTPVVAVVDLDYYSTPKNLPKFSPDGRKIDLVRATGATVYYPSSKTYNKTDFQQALLDGNVTHVLTASFYIRSPDNILTYLGINASDPSSTFPFIQNKTFYNLDQTQSNTSSWDWFGGALAQPVELVSELYWALYPQLHPGQSNEQPGWLRNLLTGESVTVTSSANCTSTTAPLELFPSIRATVDSDTCWGTMVSSSTLPTPQSSTVESSSTVGSSTGGEDRSSSSSGSGGATVAASSSTGVNSSTPVYTGSSSGAAGNQSTSIPYFLSSSTAAPSNATGSSSSDDSNLVIGLAVGLGGGAVLILLLALCFCRSRGKSSSSSDGGKGSVPLHEQA